MNATMQANRPSERTRTTATRAQALRGNLIAALAVYEPGEAAPTGDNHRLPSTPEHSTQEVA